MDVDADDKAAETKRKSGSHYCCCGCGEEIVAGYCHKLPGDATTAKAWIRSIRPSVEDDELASIIAGPSRQLTARHWLLEGDPRLKEKQVGGTVNKGRRWIPRGEGGTSSLSSINVPHHRPPANLHRRSLPAGAGVQNFPQASEVEPARFDWENVLCLCAAHQLPNCPEA